MFLLAVFFEELSFKQQEHKVEQQEGEWGTYALKSQGFTEELLVLWPQKGLMHKISKVHKLVSFKTAASDNSLGTDSRVTDSMNPLPGVDCL